VCRAVVSAGRWLLMLSTYVLLRDGRPAATDHPRKLLLLLLSNPVGESDISQQLVAHSAAVCVTSFQVHNPTSKKRSSHTVFDIRGIIGNVRVVSLD
jgi:hypothetical protein